MVAYYQHDIAKWMDGTESLPDGEYRAYHVICQLIYLHGGPIVLHESGIAGRCNQHPLAFRRNLKGLVEKHKIVLLPDGKLTNSRAETELQKIENRRRKPSADQAPIPTEPPPLPGGGAPGVQRGSSGGSTRKPLKNKDPTLFPEGPDKRIKKEVPEEANASSATDEDVRTKLFRSGLQTLARITGRTPDSCRSIVGRWLKLVDDEAIHILGAIDDAERNRIADPIPWIERALPTRGGSNGTSAKANHPGGAWGASRDRFRDARADLKAGLASARDRGGSGGSNV